MGVDVALAAMGAVTAPMTVRVLPDALSAEVAFTASMTAGVGTLTATLGADTRTAMVNVVAATGGLIINELDYDNIGTDAAEFVELYNASAAPVDLADIAVVMVNGSDSREYARVRLSGTLAPGAYAVVANAMVAVPMGVARFTLADNTIQNGMPDAVALVRISTARVIDALSYEGAIPRAHHERPRHRQQQRRLALRRRAHAGRRQPLTASERHARAVQPLPRLGARHGLHAGGAHGRLLRRGRRARRAVPLARRARRARPR
jgi:hypothetical protein